MLTLLVSAEELTLGTSSLALAATAMSVQHGPIYPQ